MVLQRLRSEVRGGCGIEVVILWAGMGLGRGKRLLFGIWQVFSFFRHNAGISICACSVKANFIINLPLYISKSNRVLPRYKTPVCNDSDFVLHFQCLLIF